MCAVVHRFNEPLVVDRTYVECVDDENRHRLYSIGARVVLRPTRSYPEIVVRAMVAPGFEAIIEGFLFLKAITLSDTKYNWKMLYGTRWSALWPTLTLAL